MSNVYTATPSTTSLTLDMMTHLSYFIAHALCERFPSTGNSYRLPALLPPGNHAELDAASSSSSSVSSANPGASRTHARTDSQATIWGPVNAAVMVRFQCGLFYGISAHARLAIGQERRSRLEHRLHRLISHVQPHGLPLASSPTHAGSPTASRFLSQAVLHHLPLARRPMG